MSLDRASIALRQSAPGLEAHHTVGIEQENRRFLDTETALKRVERRLVNLFETVGAADRVRQIEADGKRRSGGGQ
jgi:hypothetical protein